MIEKNMMEPKIGEIVTANFCDFFGLRVIRKGDRTLRYKLINYLDPEKINAITLLKYEGDGIFTEYYTQESVLFFPLIDMHVACSSFVKEYVAQRYEKLEKMDNDDLCDYLHKFPSVFTSFEQIDDTIKIQMGKQEFFREQLAEIMNNIFEYACKYVNNVSYLQRGEQIIEDFGKGLTRKLEK